MKHPADILMRPLITEKGTLLTSIGQYFFEVAPDATKIDIASAVKTVYKVEVEKVRTHWVKPKPKRLGQRSRGYTRRWKKAIVSLKPGHKIDDFAV
ncbi:MAG: 50S ribosomal protein L23 [Fimbriimonadia bacterium]|nr:50S ribosomal protein L23 [Fimbriimonadia bacterium]